MSAVGVSRNPAESEAPAPRKPTLWWRLRRLIAELRGFPVRVRRTERGLTVAADLPGVRKDEVRIELTEFALVIEVEQRNDDRPALVAGRRLIPLPNGAEVEEARAGLKNGVLTVHLSVFHRHHCQPIQVEADDQPASFNFL